MPTTTEAPAPHTEAVTLTVDGMTCAACQARVQRALEREPGVSSASVNLMMANAAVAFDPAQVTPERLVALVEATGYGASLPSLDQGAIAATTDRDDTLQAEYATLRRKAGFALGAGVVAMVASMPLMAGGEHEHGLVVDPFMTWAMTTLTPALQRVMPWAYQIPKPVLSWGLLGLTLVVMGWAGRHFYTRAWAALMHRAADMNTLVAVGTGAAFLYSIVATVAPDVFLSRGIPADVYYEAVVLIIAFVLAGNALEARAKRNTATALRSLAALQPATARVVRPEGEVRIAHDNGRVPGTPSFDEVKVGDELPVHHTRLSRGDLVNYAGVAGDANPIHWDEDIAKLAGLPDVIAHGMLTMGLGAGFASAWSGDPGAVTRYAVRLSAPAIVSAAEGCDIEFSGRIKSLDPTTRSGVVIVAAKSDGKKIFGLATLEMRFR